MTSWVRLWAEMPTDPKWRVIARQSGQPLACVIALFTYMLVEASSAADRGSITGMRQEDAAAALDMDESAVTAILVAMDGRVIADGRLSGWERRQPKREDDSTKRSQRHRARNAMQRNATHGDAPETETEADTETSDANASGAGAPLAPPAPPPPFDIRAAIFASAIPMLTTAGTPDRNARSLVGRWRKDHGDGAVLDALSAAQLETPSDPAAWITATLERRNGQSRSIAPVRSDRGPRPDPSLALFNAAIRAEAQEERAAGCR